MGTIRKRIEDNLPILLGILGGGALIFIFVDGIFSSNEIELKKDSPSDKVSEQKKTPVLEISKEERIKLVRRELKNLLKKKKEISTSGKPSENGGISS